MTIIEKNEFEIVYIPEKPPIPPHQQPTVDVYAAEIDLKHANLLIKKLNQIAPLENLRHVKRIRKVQIEEGKKAQLFVILCLASECIPNNVLELIDLFKIDIFITRVCKFAPLSKEDWEEQCKLWPTSYHPPTYNIDGISGFSEIDSQLVLYFMKLTVHMARIGDRQVGNAAMIVDPSTKQVIARACDIYDGVSCISSWDWAKKEPLARFCHPLKHAVMVAIEHSATRDLSLFPNGEATVAKFAPIEKHESQPNDRPYLCTGYDIYTVWEPCTMCAMALVHQRIRRIFYIFPNPSDGALGSVFRLQGEKSLNHHYAVFRVFLPEKVLQEMNIKAQLNEMCYH